MNTVFDEFRDSGEYLDEKKLGGVLEQMFGVDNVRSQFSVKIPGELGSKRIDYRVVTKTGTTLFVEYDGDRHYYETNVVQRDILLKHYCKFNNILFVQVPYWLQLDKRTVEFLFGGFDYIPDILPEISSFPHGFVSKKCVLPSQFSSFGWKRFVTEMKQIQRVLPTVHEQIIGSLKRKYEEQLHIVENHQIFKQVYVSEQRKSVAMEYVIGCERDPLLIGMDI